MSPLIALTGDILCLVVTFVDGRNLRNCCRCIRRCIPHGRIPVHLRVCARRIEAGLLDWIGHLRLAAVRISMEKQGSKSVESLNQRRDSHRSLVPMYTMRSVRTTSIFRTGPGGLRHRSVRDPFLRALCRFEGLRSLRLVVDDATMDIMQPVLR